MDAKKSGAFLAARRKAKGMTQKTLAQRLGVTDRAVSRWETGKGFPDISLLAPLAQSLDVTIAEIVAGEPAAPGETATQVCVQPAPGEADCASREDLAADGPVRRAATRAGVWPFVAGALFLLGLSMFVLPFWVLDTRALHGVSLWGLGVLLFALLYTLQRRSARRRNAADAGGAAWTLLAAALSIVALVLEAMPGGVTLVFAPGPGRSVARGYCYFSLTPYGYGEVAPFFTALLTAIMLALLAWLALRDRRSAGFVADAALLCGIAALLLSVLALASGLDRTAAYPWSRMLQAGVCAALTVCLLLQIVAVCQTQGERARRP